LPVTAAFASGVLVVTVVVDAGESACAACLAVYSPGLLGGGSGGGCSFAVAARFGVRGAGDVELGFGGRSGGGRGGSVGEVGTTPPVRVVQGGYE